jgi:iron complex outermembrane recepter protein
MAATARRFNCRATKFWRLQGGYTWFVPSLKLEPSSQDSSGVLSKTGVNPRNQFQVGSQFDLPRGFEFDTVISRVGRLAYAGIPA